MRISNRVNNGLFTGAVQSAKEGKGLEKIYAKKESLLLDANNIIGKTSNTSIQNYIEVDNQVRYTRVFCFRTPKSVGKI